MGKLQLMAQIRGAGLFYRGQPLRAALGLIIAIFLLAANPCVAAQGWETFKHPSLGFSIKYPAGWRLARIPVQPQHSRMHVLLEGSVGSNQQMLVSVATRNQPVPPGFSIAAFFSRTEELFWRGEPGERPPVRPLTRHRTQIVGIPALLLHWREDFDRLQMTMLTLAVAPHLYALQGVVPTGVAKFSDEIRQVQMIIMSFRPK